MALDLGITQNREMKIDIPYSPVGQCNNFSYRPILVLYCPRQGVSLLETGVQG